MYNAGHETARFRTSSYTANQGDCVEVADLVGGSLVRDSKRRDHGTVGFPVAAWDAFLRVTGRADCP